MTKLQNGMMPHFTLAASRRFTSHTITTGSAATSTSSSSPPSSHPSPSPYTAESLVREIHHLLVGPLALGYLFRSLSQDGKKLLTSQQLSIEQFLLRNPQSFAVFQEPGDRTIQASRLCDLPGHAIRGAEATGEELFGVKGVEPATRHVLNVLKYVPNEWTAFADIGVPESIRVHVMQRKAKAYFERYPQYFEVQAQSLNQHTFFVRRSLALQKQTLSEDNGK